MIYKTITKWRKYEEGDVVPEQEAKLFLSRYKRISDQELLVEVEDVVVEEKVEEPEVKAKPVAKKKATKKRLFNK